MKLAPVFMQLNYIFTQHINKEFQMSQVAHLKFCMYNVFINIYIKVVYYVFASLVFLCFYLRIYFIRVIGVFLHSQPRKALTNVFYRYSAII